MRSVPAAGGERGRARAARRGATSASRLGLALGLVVALASVPRAALASPAASIDDRAVVRIWGTGSCTAFLVRPSVFVTAKHCVQRAGEGAPLARKVQVRFDREDPTADDVPALDAAWVRTAPGVYTGDDDIDGHDFGLFESALPLAERVPGVAPLRLYTGDPAALVGEEVELLGYGERHASYRLTRAVTRIREVGRTISVEPPVSCYGDSGGPLVRVATGEVVGIASREWPVGEVPCDPSARGERSIFQRVDVYAAMLDGAASAAAGEPAAEDAGRACSTTAAPRRVGGHGELPWVVLVLGLVARRRRLRATASVEAAAQRWKQ